jgi:hypothetical protein
MSDQKRIVQPYSFLHSEKAKKLIILIVIILLATAMAGRKQFVLDPYENFFYMPQVYSNATFKNMSEQTHPLHFSQSYVPLGQRMIPGSLLFNTWFHMFSAIAFWALTIGGVFVLIRMGGFTNYQSMALTLFSLFVGNLLAKELLDIPLLGPAPFMGYQFYVFRVPIVPLSILGLILIFKRHFLLAGVFIGLATLFHIKFGFRFFSFLFFSLLLWNYWGKQRIAKLQEKITLQNIAFFALSWGALFALSYLDIMSGIQYLDSLNILRSQPHVSQLAWLIKNEPDDYLFSHYFLSSRPFFGFLFMVVASLGFCEIIIRLPNTYQWEKFAVVWEIATLGALVFWGFGFLFESYLIDWLPLNLAYSISLTRFWDLVWVVVLGFWITFILAATVVGQKLMVGLGRITPNFPNFFFHFSVAFFLCLNIAIFVKNKNGELVKISNWRSGKFSTVKVMDYVQICNDATPQYNKFYWEAVNAIQTKEDKIFQKALLRMESIYNESKVKLKNPPLHNPDSDQLKAIKHSMDGHFSKYIKETTKLRYANGADAYWWSCLHSEPGTHSRSIRIPTEDYTAAVDWVKLNLPFDKAVIQPPYLPQFTMLSQHIGFWDPKLDQHMMYMIKSYYQAGLHRLRSIAGNYAFEIEPGTLKSGLGPRSRNYFLSLTKEDIIKIRQDYPAYDYLLTENKNLQGYPVTYSNPSLVLYDISDS